MDYYHILPVGEGKRSDIFPFGDKLTQQPLTKEIIFILLLVVYAFTP